MDNNLTTVESSLEKSPNAIKSEHVEYYKLSGGLPDQDKRRAQLLKDQKNHRNKLTDEIRGIYVEDETNDMDIESPTSSKQRHEKKYKKVMMSEWLLEVPQDLDISWFMKLCPNGHRCIVIAQRNSTKSFSKNGIYECKFKSLLPGNDTSNKSTVLDCIWVPNLESFYVLDVLVWSSQDITDYDAEFRFFWLKSRISEIQELEKKCKFNDYPFHYVPHLQCDYPSITESLNSFPMAESKDPSIDGLLFYHREASYTPGRTPLVGWLKPFMVPEVLNIPVSIEYTNLRPKQYKNLKQHIEYATNKRAQKKKCPTKNEMEMEN